ncbi:hypothetical protein ILYODFUR_008866, partial [Ilyodon furcidens]
IFRTQSLEWYYDNVKSRFKRFGSAKVLKTLYRKHIIERGAFSDLPDRVAGVTGPGGKLNHPSPRQHSTHTGGPCAFLAKMGYIVPPATSESFQGSLSSQTCQENPQRE